MNASLGFNRAYILRLYINAYMDSVRNKKPSHIFKTLVVFITGCVVSGVRMRGYPPRCVTSKSVRLDEFCDACQGKSSGVETVLDCFQSVRRVLDEWWEHDEHFTVVVVVVYTETLACVVRPTDSTHQPGKPIFSGRYHRRFFGARQVRGRDQRAIPRQPIFIGHPTYVRPRGC